MFGLSPTSWEWGYFFGMISPKGKAAPNKTVELQQIAPASNRPALPPNKATLSLNKTACKSVSCNNCYTSIDEKAALICRHCLSVYYCGDVCRVANKDSHNKKCKELKSRVIIHQWSIDNKIVRVVMRDNNFNYY